MKFQKLKNNVRPYVINLNTKISRQYIHQNKRPQQPWKILPDLLGHQ